MHFKKFSFGSIEIDDQTYEHDVVIDRGEIRKRKKGPSKKFRADFGHTPLSIEKNLPWKCRQLVIGTGAYGNLPVMREVEREAERLQNQSAANANTSSDRGAKSTIEGDECGSSRHMLI